ncbi:MAG TPA: hypothetical protein VGZ24_10990 [Chthoniobacterales bacterium]|nr:hypothetical protein [Chthoniobacterales bacterium]
MGTKPVYRWLKARRAEQFAAAGDAFAQAGQWNDAAQKYRAALQLDPLGYRGLEGGARLATRLGRPEAVDLWEQVYKLPQCTTADRQEYADLLVKLDRLNVGQRIIERLLKNDPDARTLDLASRYSQKTGDSGKAIEFARLAVKRSPNDSVARFQLAELLAQTTDLAQRTEARKLLWELAVTDGVHKRPAIEALARAPELSGVERKRVLEALDILSPPNITDALLASDLRIQLHPEDADRIYDETIARWSRGEIADLIQLARWLNLHQQPERVLSLFSIERALKNNELFLTRLDALGILQRWNEIEELLTRSDLSFDPSVVESFRARTAQERNATLDAELHWNHAVALAAGDPFKLRFVANFAERSHADAAALKAYEQLAKFPEHAAFAYRGIQRQSQQTGEVSAQLAAAEKISALAPDDPDAAAQLAYLNLLLETDVEANLATAKKLAEKYPNRLSFRVTAALGYLRHHDAGSALAQFKAPAPIDWKRAQPAWRAVYAAALLANDRNDEAREMIGTIPLDHLSPEERALLEPSQEAR